MKMSNQHLNEHNYFLDVPAPNHQNVFKYLNIVFGEEHHNDSDNIDIKEELSDENDEEKPSPNDLRAISYTLLPGVRLNSQIYMDNLHYRYHKHSAYNNKEYLTCENRKNRTVFCPVKAFVSTDRNNRAISVSGHHNHLPPFVDIPMVHLRREIGLAGTQVGRMFDSVRQIYNSEIVRNPEGARNYTFQQSRNRINRLRRSRRLNNPSSIEKFVEMLRQQQNSTYSSMLQHPPSRFFQEQLFVEDKTVGVVFTNLDPIERYGDICFMI